MPALPSVTVVIPNWNGAAHLPDCLDSLDALDYPSDRITVIVVDNGSTDASRDLIGRRYPHVHLVGLARNDGFAAACNAGVREARSECIAFMNNDMRAEQTWLRRLVEAYDPGGGYVCIGGVILNWDGSQLDFVEGSVNFQGFAWQQHLNEPFQEGLIRDGAQLLFACGGSMLISRDVYLDVGGFDPSYFAYYEDVDLGWRLWLSGYKVRLAGGARVFHRHHGSATALPPHLPSFLYERNALLTLFKNLSDENFSRVLVPALLLLAQKVALLSGRVDGGFEDTKFSDATTEIRPAALIPLHAVASVIEQLPEVLKRRREVQARRRRSDAAIFDLFIRPFTPWMHDERYLEASIRVRDAFGLDELFKHQRARQVLVVVESEEDDYFEVREQLVGVDSVTIWPQPGSDTLGQLIAESDVVVVATANTEHAQEIAAETRGLLVVLMRSDERSGDPALLARADVLLGRSNGATPLEKLNAIVREPWRWRRHDTVDRIAVPEDLQWLLWARRMRASAPTQGEPPSRAHSLGLRRVGGRVLRRLRLRV